MMSICCLYGLDEFMRRPCRVMWYSILSPESARSGWPRVEMVAASSASSAMQTTTRLLAHGSRKQCSCPQALRAVCSLGFVAQRAGIASSRDGTCSRSTIWTFRSASAERLAHQLPSAGSRSQIGNCMRKAPSASSAERRSRKPLSISPLSRSRCSRPSRRHSRR